MFGYRMHDKIPSEVKCDKGNQNLLTNI